MKDCSAISLFLRCAAVLVVLVSCPWTQAAAQSDELMQVYRQGVALYKAGRHSEAEPLLLKVLQMGEQEFGPEHKNTATLLNNLALLYAAQGRYADAEPLYKRSLAIWEKALGPDHPGVAISLNNLAELYRTQGRYAEALNSARRASAIQRGRATQSGVGRSGGAVSEQKKVRGIFLVHVGLVLAVADREPDQRSALTAEGFEAGQLARATSTAAAVAGMGARFASGNDTLANLVRERQDMGVRWQRTDKKLIDAVGKPPAKRQPKVERQLRSTLAILDNKLKDLKTRLNREFPKYEELASPKPLSLRETQKLLGPHEALLAYAVWDDSTFLWVVRRDQASMHSVEIGKKALDKAIAELRNDLDLSVATAQSFNTMKAYELYQKLFAVAEPSLKGVQHMFVVPDGALQSLPLGVLVTKKPKGNGYRNASWLAKKYALATLPSVSSLRALRTFAQATQASKPFMGFGDPVLKGHPGDNRGIKLKKYFKPQGGVDVEMVRTRLAPLPETANELMAMARTLGASKDSLFLRNRATETVVKSTDLSDTRVLAFATHGLIAGELGDLAEPALVLTPPKKGTSRDDGLLTASEVATLKLNSDLVILSACNTAASDGTPNADALSGLAKAFFYAGSRSLLVSHWPVQSDAAVKLTTRMLKEIANDNKVGRSEALRRSMIALMASPKFAHPAYWAPFVVVGEGGTYKAN